MADFNTTNVPVTALYLAADADESDIRTFATNDGVDIVDIYGQALPGISYVSGPEGRRYPLERGQYVVTYADGTRKAFWPSEMQALYDQAVTCAVTGSFLTTPTEAEVVTGGQQVILTLTGAKWAPADDPVAAPTVFPTAVATAIRNGMDSDGAAAGGWDAKVKAVMAVGNVVRTNDTVVTITLPATADYVIAANETITVTVPALAIDGGIDAVVAAPTFTIVNA
jgi:hypothetical protein